MNMANKKFLFAFSHTITQNQAQKKIFYHGLLVHYIFSEILMVKFVLINY